LSIKKRCGSICLNGEACKNHALADSDHCKRHSIQEIIVINDIKTHSV
jgi:hypothetical protein